jgi:curved DNA-binding protein CbpA
MQEGSEPDLKPNYYEVLQLQPYANPALVVAAYRILSKLYHPDTAKEHASLENFRMLQQAYETLSDPQRRMEYDRELRLKTPQPASSVWSGFRPEPETDPRDPLWNNPANGAYTPSPEDLEFYKNLYEYESGGKRRRAILLLVIYIILMAAAVGFGMLGFFSFISGGEGSLDTAIFCFCLAVLLLIVAQIEAYYS